MAIISTPLVPHAPGTPYKPLASLAPPNPTYASEQENADLLVAILRKLPRNLDGDLRSPHPLLDALTRLDASHDTDLARQLIFIAAVNHRTADERRSAEYLLRNRHDVVSGKRSAHALLMAARCAAEMDVRRAYLRELPVPNDAVARWMSGRSQTRTDDPSVGEMVVDKLRAVTGHRLTSLARHRLLDAVSIALELAQRHALNRGTGPSLLGMRADARKEARLVTHLRGEFRNEAAACAGARLLVGADRTPIETALLWWSARPNLTALDVTPSTRRRWTRYVRTVEAAFAATSTRDGAAGCRVIHRGALVNSCLSLACHPKSGKSGWITCASRDYPTRRPS